MMNLEFLKHNEEELTVNITSLIDVIFILLIFFMVSTQFKKTSLPLDLPRTEETTESTQQDSTKVLAVNTSQMELDGKIISLEELEPTLSKLYAENPNIALSLECERTVDFEHIVQILTKIQNAGISRIGIVHESLED
ncbi:MAG: biopolymer transporter ExbD [Treponema sp.]|uniref:ExbD/TolR family protein n=1 Tax=Treponema sp. TaxID=166 RepID=UPI0025F01549|nr:biopolymer transporter ExbD [Treponema sp.]MBR0495349.1 biopolymer transporter ExbD [Treponema sp.]